MAAPWRLRFRSRGDITAFDGKQFYEVRGYAPGRNLEGRGRGISPFGDLFDLFRFSPQNGWNSATLTRSPASAAGKNVGKLQHRSPGTRYVASENTVLAAGVPMLQGYSQEDTDSSYAGEKGGIAWLLDASDGHLLQELRFDAPPVWDGIAIARGSYFVCLKDGAVVCLSSL